MDNCIYCFKPDSDIVPVKVLSKIHLRPVCDDCIIEIKYNRMHTLDAEGTPVFESQPKV